MKSLSKVFRAAVVVLVGTVAAQALADPIWSYNFEDCTAGIQLAGQGNWQTVPTTFGWNSASVVDLGGTWGNAASSSTLSDTVKVAGAVLSFSSPISFTAADIAVKHYAQFNLTSAGCAYTSLTWDSISSSPHLMSFGLEAQTSGTTRLVRPTFRDAAGSSSYGSYTLELGHWYELEAVYDFSFVSTANPGKGGKLVSLSYRDITTGSETDWVEFTSLAGKELKLTPSAGQYQATGALVRLDRYSSAVDQHQYVDNLSIGEPLGVPEPSTLALLAAGLLGLLAYAWRKRK